MHPDLISLGFLHVKTYGAFMALLTLAIVPIVIFYVFCQKHIIKGVVSGAVKG